MTLKHLFESRHLREAIAVLTVRRFSAPLGVLLGLGYRKVAEISRAHLTDFPEEGVYSTTQHCQTLA